METSQIFTRSTGQFPSPQREREFAHLNNVMLVRVTTLDPAESRSLANAIVNAFEQGNVPAAQTLIETMVETAAQKSRPLRCVLDIQSPA